MAKQGEKEIKAAFNAGSARIIENRIWFVSGIIILALGALIYMTDRAPGDVYFTRFLGIDHELFGSGFRLPGDLGNVLPAFFHVLGLSLITAAFTSGTRKQCLLICAGWFLISAIMETGQKYNGIALQLTPGFFDNLPFLEATRAYFLNGIFDPKDIVAAGIGAAVAFWLMAIMKPKASH